MIRKKQINSPIVIDLTGPNGNAFVLIQCARDLSHKLGLDFTPIREEMMDGDYDHLISVFDSYFGDFVILEV